MDSSQGIERLLAELGLQKERSTASYLLPALGVFAAGALVGGVLALLFAPKSGRELRSDLATRIGQGGDHEPGATVDHGDRTGNGR